MKNLFVIKRFYLLMLFVVIGFSQMYGGATYYAKATAAIGTATGEGKVYASDSQTNSPDYGESNTVTNSVESTSGSANITFYMYARAEEGSEFTGWSTSNNGDVINSSNTSPYAYSVNSNVTDESNAPVSTLYAIFQKLPTFSFSASAIVLPNEDIGTATVSPATTNVYGEHWNSTSATTNAITFTAEPKLDEYDFRGWSRTADGEIESTASPYNPTLTSNNPDASVSTTLYARFAKKPVFAFSATAVVTPAGAGTATVDPATTSVRGDKWNSTSATTNEFVFSATPASNYTFLGWSKTADGEIVSQSSSYKPTLTSNNPAASLNTTLYARFQIYPTGITATPASIVLGVNRSSNPISVSLVPQGSYKNIVFETSNSAIATVDANGVVTAKSTAGTATITIKAFKSDGVTVLATASVAVSVLEYCATPVITIAPSSDGKTATVTLSSTTPGATIYYTTDRNDPTASSMPYSSAFSISNGQTVKAIAVKDGYLNSAIATDMYSAEKVATPTIDITTSGVSFSCETPGVSFYYTINGDNPTTSLTPWNGAPLTGLSEGTNIKVIAAKSGMIISDVATKLYYPASGVVGDVVTLNDYEDHNWSYYSDPDCPIHSWNPADVKITYYGNGTATVTTTNDDNPTSFTADATGVKVGIDADANTFVYYKTLERTDGSTAAAPSAATGRCAYTTIPNPFSVRPTYGSGDTRWRGFYKWRVKRVSGGTIHSASTGGVTYAQGSTIDSEEEIYFSPNAEYGMEVEFEALWARAYVVTSNTATGLRSTVSYERNFVYLSSNTELRNAALSCPVTYTTLDPSTGNGTKRTITIRDGFTCNANTKFENLTFAQYNNNAQTLTANGHDLIVGRGCLGTVNYVRGISENITNPNYTIRLESGTYNYFSALRGYQARGGSDGTDTGSSMGGTPSIKVIFGCDYDRATNTGITDNLAITNGAFYGYRVSEGNNITYSETAFRSIVKSGKIGNGFTINDSYAAKADGTFYIGVAGERVRGCRNLLIEGGQIASIAGGIDNEANLDKNSVKIRMKGGHVRGVVYGGGARSAAYGSRTLIFTGGTVTGWIGGGCNGEPMPAGQQNEDTYGGITHGASFVYFGGDAICGGEGSNVSINGSIGGVVFGAGKGVEGNTTSGRMANGTTVAIADNCNIQRNVYGGGNYGYAQNSTNLFIGGGLVQGGVFGGSNQNNAPAIHALMKGGIIEGGFYGGSNSSGTSANVTMQINGGQVGTSSKSANIHGGGYGQNTTVSGNVDITLGADGQTTGGVTVYGDVYGGSALGTVNSDASDHTYVTMYKGTINGSLYGGGLGSASVAANVNGPVKVEVHGGSVKATSVAGSGGVYGANNIYGAPQSSVTVDIYGTDPAPAEGQYALYAVYGGGNQADYLYGNGYPTVTVHGCDNSIEYVYGGGNAAAVKTTNVTIWGGNVIGNVFGGGHGYKDGAGADVEGDVNVAIKGGTIKRVFGGSNSKGNISGTINLDINKDGACDMRIGEVYGGGNEADGNAGAVTIGCTGALVEGDEGHAAHPENIGKKLEGIGAVYGGANNANVTNASGITLNINSGMVANVFGGNNTGGGINGTITVNVNKNEETCGWYVGNVFGGGNLAQYSGSPAVNILNGEVSGNVYGGGKGDANDHSKGQVTGNPTVTIGDKSNAGYEAIVKGDVYGGGDAGNVVGTPIVNVVNKCNTTIGHVYGGGNAADVNGTDVNIDGGTITGMVFGGGHGDKNADPQTEANVNGNVNVDITGGTINKVFGGSNSKGNITGTIAMNIEKADGHCELHITEVYGGGNEAAGNAGTITIGCTGSETEGIGDVYGGANAADINTPITLNITGGNISRVFGGNNTSGSINGDIQVNVDWTGTCGVNALGNVYGAGNQAAYSGNTEVNILNGTVTGSVYGGGLGATAIVTGTTKVNIDGSADGHSVMVTQNVLGGGDAAAVTGSTDVNIINGAISGSVFGGGNAAGVSENGVVDITGGTIASGVYGGSNASGAVGNTIVTLTNGIIGTNAAHANVHGGGYGKETKVSGNVAVNIQGGTIYGDVYGGSALGTVNTDANNTTAVNLTGGIIHGDAYGGGLGASGIAADVNGNVTVTLNGTAFTLATTKDDEDNTIPTSGRVFGCNNVNGSPKGTVLVKVLQTVARDGEGNVKAKPAKNSGVYELQAVYGGGNLAAYNPTNPTANGQFTTYTWDGNAIPHDNLYKPLQVVIDGCGETSIEYVYGGGNAAATPATDVTILGSYEIGSVFGGGNGKDKYTLDGATWNKNKGADVGIIDAAAYATDKSQGKYGTGDAMTSVLGGTVHNIYGGSNTLGNIVGSAIAYMDAASDCPLDAGDIYGGGNEAYMDGNSGIQLGCIEYLKEIYGGARNADVGGDINLTITSGHFDRVFGGNNLGGTIKGSITVNIEETGCNPITIGELYGCGNKAPYTTPGDKHPTINIRSFTSIGNVYGGGLGKEAVVTGNPTVNINVATGANNAIEDWPYNGSTIDFGGGITVTLPVHEKGKIGAIGNVFGGGNAAAVIGNTQVNIGTEASKSADIRGNVYGGGNQADVTGQTNVVIGG